MRTMVILNIVMLILVNVSSYSAAGDSHSPLYKNGTFSLEIDFKIGGDTEDEDLFLYQPSDIAVDSKGNLFVLDFGMTCIHKFDPNGKHLKTFGREGQGPGELSGSAGMSINPNDDIVVYEMGNRRFTIFDNKGEYVGTHKFIDFVWDFDICAKGYYYVETREMDLSERDKTLVRIIQISPDFERSACVDSAYIKENKYITSPTVINVPVPFHADLCWAVMPSGNIVVARSEDYCIKVFNPDLELLLETKHDGRRIKVTKEDKEKHFAEMTISYGDFTEKRVPDFIRRETEFPEHKPCFSAIMVDNEGYILTSTYEVRDGGTIYDVFSNDCKFVNSVNLSDLSQSFLFAGEAIYDIKTCEEELPVVVCYRVIKPAR